MWPNFGEINSSSYKDIVSTRFSSHSLLRPWPLTLWSQNLISTYMNPNTSVTKLGEIPFIGFWDMLFTAFLGCTDSLTHRRTDLNTECFWHRVPTAVEAQICILTSCIPLFKQLDMMCHIELCSSFSYTPTLQEIHTSLESLAHLQ